MGTTAAAAAWRGHERLGECIGRGVAGTLLARPWFDRAGLFALQHWFFPLSRLWAAARAASGDVEAFYREVPMSARLEDRQRLSRALARFEASRAAANAIEAEWGRVFFGPEITPESYRVAVETARLELRHAYNASRRHFRFLATGDVPRVKLAVDTPQEAEQHYGATIADATGVFAEPSPPPPVVVSHKITGPDGVDFWLRFTSPSARLGDTVWARVHEPSGITDPPTVIYGHGICVEFDHWRGLIDECRALVRLGFRVIRPEAPWHGRRAPPGRFGGEHVIGSFPTGILDALLGAVQEWAALAHWARQTSTGPLVLAGSSLGALTAQLTADHARRWPQALQPDAMLLITHTGDLAEAVTGGALSNLWASPAKIAQLGWSHESTRRILAILDPGTTLVMPPSRVVSVLGRRDVILPFKGGEALVKRWNLPAENRFVWDRGHFSVPMSLVHNDAPLQRLARIVAELRA